MVNSQKGLKMNGNARNEDFPPFEEVMRKLNPFYLRFCQRKQLLR